VLPRRILAARVAAVVLTAALALSACSSSGNRPTLSADASQPAGTGVVATSSTLPKTCATLKKGESLVATAARTGALNIYARPGAPQPVRTMANPFLVNNDPGAPVPLTFLVKAYPVVRHCSWLQVYLPVRPNGSTGWVRSADVMALPNPYKLEADLNEFTMKVFKGGQQIDAIKIGVAKNNTPTPGGIYYTTELIKTPNPDGDYGPYAYGLSGYSDTLTSFNGGPGQLGIHGTNEPQYLGTRVSHGCIRMSNDDITKLAHLLPLGTPVQINT
jgi:lipoprotein-anchoring transpeptidase ErfK/SrfK